MTILPILASVFGSAMALANIPQAIKIFKRKSAKDISLITYLILLAGGIVWILYGIEIKSFPLILTNILGVCGVLLVIIGWFIYRK